ncbi:hypothetical protein ENUP19_0377G0002 [Entamoeba nuttalli]|uniref:Leucine rich repeat protein, BspA family protein n=1 Tax=Entamoeba nuttalli TaxID=412467 RepID=A0ABQ0DZD7_9EUKA
MQLGYNEIMIVSKYFEDINDFINLEIGIKRFQGNMERFHFNPIPLNQYSRKLFPNIETFHIYNKYDEIFEDGRIFKYVIWYNVSYSTYLEEKEEMNEYKNIEYTQEDVKKYGNTIPPEVNSIGNNCFYRCYDIQLINIPTSISKIGNECFYECSSLISIDIPTSINKIGYGCFYECTSLTTINILSSITSFGNRCFDGCSSLRTINIPTSVTKIGYGCFSLCKSLTSINIPTSVIEIGEKCFGYCTSLTSINIPTSVIEIGNECFECCISLELINIEDIKYISEERIFMNESVLISIKIPENLKIINGKIIEKKDINEFIIPSTITEIGNYCFCGCLSLTSINIPTSVSKIGYGCFYECKSLISINIQSSITSFGIRCFYGCGCEEELKKNKTIPKYCFYI